MEIVESFSSQELMLNKRALVDIARCARFGSALVSALCIEKATAFNILFLQRTCEVMLLYKGILIERRKILIDLAHFSSDLYFYISYLPGFLFLFLWNHVKHEFENKLTTSTILKIKIIKDIPSCAFKFVSLQKAFLS